MPRGLNLFWGYLQDGSIVTLGMNVKEIKAPGVLSCDLMLCLTKKLQKWCGLF